MCKAESVASSVSWLQLLDIGLSIKEHIWACFRCRGYIFGPHLKLGGVHI